MTQALTVQEQESATQLVIDPRVAKQQLQALQAVVKDVMREGEHFGVIPGTDKMTLLKAGAEMLCNVYGFMLDRIEIIEKTEQWDVPIGPTTFPLFRYIMRATLKNSRGLTIAEGVGECNSYETKYRWRSANRKCPICEQPAIIKGKSEYGGGWVCFAKKGGCGAKFKDGDPAIEAQPTGRQPNEAIYDQINTLIKMAKKRAYVDAALSATRTSNVFTQDMEDFATIESIESHAVKPSAVVAATPKQKEADKRFVVSEGLHKGKDMRELTEKQLDGLIAFLKTKPQLADQLKAAELCRRDPFAGKLDEPAEVVEVEPVKMSSDEISAEDAKIRQNRLDEIRELLAEVVPKVATPKAKLTKAERDILVTITTDALEADSWEAITHLSTPALEAGIGKLAKIVHERLEAEAKEDNRKTPFD